MDIIYNFTFISHPTRKQYNLQQEEEEEEEEAWIFLNSRHKVFLLGCK
jgi:NADH:ubiquinone oxidoreductase subunit C